MIFLQGHAHAFNRNLSPLSLPPRKRKVYDSTVKSPRSHTMTDRHIHSIKLTHVNAFSKTVRSRSKDHRSRSLDRLSPSTNSETHPLVLSRDGRVPAKPVDRTSRPAVRNGEDQDRGRRASAPLASSSAEFRISNGTPAESSFEQTTDKFEGRENACERRVTPGGGGERKG